MLIRRAGSIRKRSLHKLIFIRDAKMASKIKINLASLNQLIIHSEQPQRMILLF